jgi:tRNA(Ile)-lysidine synthase
MVYQHLFLIHLEKFIKAHLNTPLSSIAVGVSGGVDSMTLLWALVQLKNKGMIHQLRVLYFHHHTRKGQDLDRDLVMKESEKYGLPFKMGHGKNLNKTNFEHEARTQRHRWFKSSIQPGERLFLAHHLDDTFEWLMMQEGRSMESLALGIPLRNGAIFRPFLCVTKKQILKLAKLEKISFREDPTNSNDDHLRNQLRLHLIPVWEKLFPDYISRMVIKLRARYEQKTQLKDKNKETIFYHPGETLILGRPSYSLLRKQVEWIAKTRGMWGKELLKLIEAQKEGKKGPMHLSGGLFCYMNKNSLLLSFKKKLDVSLFTDQDEKMNRTELINWLKVSFESQKYHWDFPYVLPIKRKFKKLEGLGRELNNLQVDWQKQGFYLYSIGFILHELQDDEKIVFKTPQLK